MWLLDKMMLAGVMEYADDLILLAPSSDAFQEMMSNCENHMKDKNISISTYENPKKYRTKYMAFINNDRDAINVTEKILPWVRSAKHLGCTITGTSGELTSGKPTITPSNFQNLMKVLGKSTIGDLHPKDALHLTYIGVPEGEQLKVVCV